MKKVTVFTVITLLITLSMQAQKADFITLLEEPMYQSVDLIPSNNGNYIIAGKAYEGYHFFITEITGSGDILWHTYYEGEMLWYGNVLQKTNGNLLIPYGNFRAQLLETGPGGDSLDCISIQELNSAYFGKVMEIPGPEYLATEEVYNNDYFPSVDCTYFVRFDEENNIIEKQLAADHYVTDMIMGTSVSFFTIEQTTMGTSSIVKRNMDLAVLSDTFFPEYQPYLSRLGKIDDNEYAALGMSLAADAAMLCRFDSSGAVMYINTHNYDFYMDMAIDETGETLYLLGNRSDSCFIRSMDRGGNIISDVLVDDSLEGNSIHFSDGYLYIAGEYDDDDDQTPSHAAFIKMNQDSLIAVPETASLTRLKVFPNPTSDFVVFELPFNTQQVNSGTECTILIHDIHGRPVRELELNAGKATWNAKDTSPDIYIYTLSIGGHKHSGKLLIKR
ncbi:MAG: T9SS type A sorting domain-containing protein [Bacteroidales bacterium]|nr:T9SS type A sorting domain-containing protein [Bacteroidales bacterium]